MSENEELNELRARVAALEATVAQLTEVLTVTGSPATVTLADGHGNTLAMTSEGISLKTTDKLQLVGDAAVAVQSNFRADVDAEFVRLNGTMETLLKGMNVKIDSSAETLVEGSNVKIESKALTTVNGGAEVKIDSSGMVKVQGALITLN